MFAAITATFLAVTEQSNNCSNRHANRPVGLIAVVSYDFVHCNRPTLRLSNSQGKVATLIR